jgi:hypothetical protein
MKTTLSLALSLFICTTAYSQNTWIVDQSGAGDFTEIQLAIDSLSVVDGDEVIVKDGTYFEHINFNQKEILLRSENGAATTIIDGGGSGDVVSIINGEQAPTELRGFTVTNGGLGVYCFNYSSITISECIISMNSSHGIEAKTSANLSLRDCDVFSNGQRGILVSELSSLNATRVSIRNHIYTDAINYVFVRGAGLHISDSSAFFTECDISSNEANNDFGGGYYMHPRAEGAGIYSSNSTIRLVDSTVNDNICRAYAGWSSSSTASRGAGISMRDESDITIIDSEISRNQAADTYNSASGGGIYCDDIVSSIIISNTLMLYNSADTGSAIWTAGPVGYFSSLTVMNDVGLNAIVGGVLTNSIIRGMVTFPDCPTTYSCVEGGKAGVGNFSVDPMFETGPQGDYYLSQTSSGQAADSPCIDAGDPNSTLIIGTTRTDELDDTGIVDIGYHYNGDNYDPNNAPVAVNDTASTVANNDVVISVLLNDSDADGDTLSVVSVTTPLNGTATLNGDDVTYSPLLDWSGIDTFTYDVSDSNGGVSTATVTVTVDAPPTLNITPIISGGIVNVTITGSAPRGTFILCWSFNGPGPTPIGGTNLNLSLSPPIRTAAPFMLDTNGDGAMNPVNVPNWLTPGTGMWFQGAVIDIAGGSGVTLSNALDMVVQ